MVRLNSQQRHVRTLWKRRLEVETEVAHSLVHGKPVHASKQGDAAAPAVDREGQLWIKCLPRALQRLADLSPPVALATLWRTTAAMVVEVSCEDGATTICPRVCQDRSCAARHAGACQGVVGNHDDCKQRQAYPDRVRHPSNPDTLSGALP